MLKRKHQLLKLLTQLEWKQREYLIDLETNASVDKNLEMKIEQNLVTPNTPRQRQKNWWCFLFEQTSSNGQTEDMRNNKLDITTADIYTAKYEQKEN